MPLKTGLVIVSMLDYPSTRSYLNYIGCWVPLTYVGTGFEAEGVNTVWYFMLTSPRSVTSLLWNPSHHSVEEASHCCSCCLQRAKWNFDLFLVHPCCLPTLNLVQPSNPHRLPAVQVSWVPEPFPFTLRLYVAMLQFKCNNSRHKGGSPVGRMGARDPHRTTVLGQFAARLLGLQPRIMLSSALGVCSIICRHPLLLFCLWSHERPNAPNYLVICWLYRSYLLLRIFYQICLRCLRGFWALLFMKVNCHHPELVDVYDHLNGLQFYMLAGEGFLSSLLATSHVSHLQPFSVSLHR